MPTPPKVCLLRIGDGREDVHERSAASLGEMLPTIDHLVTVDDADHKLGFAGAIAEGWRQVRKLNCDFVFHAEMDFLYCSPIPLERMIDVLKRRPYLVQMALKRQPVNHEELRRGGVVEVHPESFVQQVDGGDVWTEHRRFFTTNPSLYPASLCWQDWPQVPQSEGHFSLALFEDPKAHAAFWGPKFSPPLVEHIGGVGDYVRAGHGY